MQLVIAIAIIMLALTIVVGIVMANAMKDEILMDREGVTLIKVWKNQYYLKVMNAPALIFKDYDIAKNAAIGALIDQRKANRIMIADAIVDAKIERNRQAQADFMIQMANASEDDQAKMVMALFGK